MPPKRATAAKKTAVPIPKAGAKSVDPNDALKKALEAKATVIDTSSKPTEPDAVDSKISGHKQYTVLMKDGKSYSAYLNCADLKNNNNKFYVC